MTSQEFKQWCDQTGNNQSWIAKMLGVTRMTLYRYRTSGDIPKTTQLACVAYEVIDYISELESKKVKVNRPIERGYAKSHFREKLSEPGELVALLKSEYIKKV